MKVTLDFETRSECDLKKEGAFKYSLHPTTMPTCLAFKLRGHKARLIKFDDINQPWRELPKEFRHDWIRLIVDGYLFVAHNAFFETCIYKNILVARYGWPDIDFRNFRCTAAKAAACALPRSLGGAGEAMNLSTQKDRRGYSAMMATCKPTKNYNAWKKARDKFQAGVRINKRTMELASRKAPPKFLEPEAAPEVWRVLYKYCEIDVVTEELLDDSLPDLTPLEQEIWFLNQRLNWRGLRVDVPTISKIVGLMEVESKKKLKELDKLTMGLVTKPGARRSILEFLALEGIELPDIKAKTVEDILKDGELSDDMRRLLEIRKALSKTSTKKYQGFLNRAWIDDRIRDILLYHGASTGRDTGTGVQPHNFPRGTIKVNKDRPYATVENVATQSPEILELLYGESLAIVFSSILRNMIIPTKGYELYVADFSKIEVAVLWWLSDNWKGLSILKSGRDPYIYQATANLGKSYEEIEKAVENEERWAIDTRQLGKAQVLGCGFYMSWKKFKSAAFDQYRLKLTGKQSVKAVKDYRQANAPVVDLWANFEVAAIAAVRSPGKTFKAGKCKFIVEKDFFWIELPSGRKLAYRSPSIIYKAVTYTVLEEIENDDGEVIEVEKERTGKAKPTIQFLGLDKSKKKLTTEFLHGGIITENIVQAVARDLMMPAMLRLEKKSYIPLLMVHDEGICEAKIGKGNIEEFQRVMCQLPKWADKNLPLDAKGWIGPRYRK